MGQTQVQEQICRGAQEIGPGQATLGPQMAMAPLSKAHRASDAKAQWLPPCLEPNCLQWHLWLSS